MDALESKIIEILKRGTPLRAIQIAQMLKVERREVNHYLYSSLKHLVVQDSDYRWKLKTNQISNTQNHPTQPRHSQSQSSQPIRQDSIYRLTKTNIRSDEQYQAGNFQTKSSQPVKQNNPCEVIKKELNQSSAEEKVEIIETAFRQDRFTELEDEQINALQSILEESKREVNIANTAYKQGKLTSVRNNPIAIAVVSIVLTLGAVFVINYLQSTSTNQLNPTIEQSE